MFNGIESVPTPPLAPKSSVEDPTVAEQRAVVVDGAVTLVEAELSHAIAERLDPAATRRPIWRAAETECVRRGFPAHAGKSPV